MSRPILLCALALSAALPFTSSAQEPAADDRGVVLDATVRGILEAIRLPGVTQEARRAGIPDEDIAKVIDIARERDLPPEERREIFEGATEIARETGPVDNFGAFVQARLAEGLRGRALAEAIRAEHQLRGKGKGQGMGQGMGQGQGQGQGQYRNDDAKSQEMRGGKPEDAGENDHSGESRRGEKGKKNENQGGGS